MVSSMIAGAMLFLAAPFQHYVFNLDTNVCDVAARDIAGGGQSAIFVLCCDEKSRPLRKYAAVFLADSNGAYPADPSFRLDLAPSISALFFAETDGKPPVELVAADAEQATVYHYENGQFTPIMSPHFRSLLPSGAREPVFLKDAAVDLNGDGIDKWLMPMPSGYEIREGEKVLTTVPCDVHNEITTEGGVYIVNRLPSTHTFSLPGQKNKVLGFLSDEYADFAYGDNWSEHARFKVPLNLEEKWEASTKMDDINGDGLPDLVVTQTRGSINLKAITHVYLSTAPFQYPDKPDAVFELDGGITAPVLIDVDGDGKKDMVMISIPIGVKNILNYLVRRKVSVHAEVYLFKNGAFAKKPSYSENFTLDAPEGRERVAYTISDFNGDGRVDVAYAADANHLEVHLGTAERMISPKPWVTVDMPSFGVARPLELSGKKHKDLVVFHPGGNYKKRVDVVTF